MRAGPRIAFRSCRLFKDGENAKPKKNAALHYTKRIGKPKKNAAKPSRSNSNKVGSSGRPSGRRESRRKKKCASDPALIMTGISVHRLLVRSRSKNQLRVSVSP